MPLALTFYGRRTFGRFLAIIETLERRHRGNARGDISTVALQRMDVIVGNLSDSEGNLCEPYVFYTVPSLSRGPSLRLSGFPSKATDYSYHLHLNGTSVATLTSKSVFGTLYGLESFLQLLTPAAGSLSVAHASIDIHDVPENVWRGLMVDSGRRFFPVSLMESILDTMAAVKLNVLHLHAADYCRWSIESKLFPNLTHSDVTGTSPGFWTQAEAPLS